MNDDENWVSSQVLAIDQGALMLMIENAQSGLLWKTMNRIDAIQKAFQKIGFQPGSKELEWKDPPQAKAVYIPGGMEIDGMMKDWPGGAEVLTLDKNTAEFGDFRKKNDALAKIRFAWDEDNLYFVVEMQDDSLVAKQAGNLIWRDDSFEIFLDSDGDGLLWEDDRDFQIGFRPVPGTDEVSAWSWFQQGEDPVQSNWAQARSYSDNRGYMIEGSIRWERLGIVPQAGLKVSLSPAVHDVDADRTHRKLQWFFRSEGLLKQFQLGTVILEGKHDKAE